MRQARYANKWGRCRLGLSGVYRVGVGVIVMRTSDVHGELWQRRSGLRQSCYRLAAKAYAWCRGVERQTQERGGASW